MSIKITTLVLCFFFILPFIASYCSEQPQSNCGINGTQCQYYKWFNNSCLQPSSCPSGTTFLNSTINCEACGSLDSLNCASCSQQGYFFHNSLILCTTCQAAYGYFCTSCNSLECLSCNTSSGLSVAPDKQSCVAIGCGVSYCISCFNATACGRCDNQHLLYAGICICQIANCQSCTKSSLCQQCFENYILTSTKSACNPICIRNCISCNDLTTCTTCITGYTYTTSNLGNSCQINCSLSIVPNCQSCTSLTSCSQCISGYSFNSFGSACILTVTCNVTSCQTCNNSSSRVCTKCIDGYKVVSNGSCQLDICTIPFCIQCNGFATCSNCTDYYVLDINNTVCKPDCNISNCIQCASISTCGKCAQGYAVTSGFCSSLCPNPITNCDICETAATCYSCKTGFLLSSDKTTCSFNCKIEGCRTCASFSTCASCTSDYTLVDGRCSIKCVRGFYQGEVTTVGKVGAGLACIRCPSKCLSCSQVSGLVICTLCSDLFYLQSLANSPVQQSVAHCLACTTIDVNCYTCLPNAPTCTSCLKGYILSSNNTCQIPFVCNVSNCNTCTSSSSFCQICNDGYTLENANGTCSKPTCPSGQTLQGSICTCGDRSYYFGSSCLPCNDNCLACSVTSCSSCTPGFFPSGTNCNSCSNNCLSCITGSVCYECAIGFSLISSICQPSSSPVSIVNGTVTLCPAACATCTRDGSGNVICTAAQDHYVIVDGAIYICDSNCFTCRNVINPTSNTFSYCLSCYDGQGLQSSACVNCIDPHARTCSTSNAAFSLSCATGYILFNGQCATCAPNCLKCTNTGAGQCDPGSCETGFIQIRGSNLCVTCFAGCTTCDRTNPNLCLDCGLYRFAINGICQSCSSNCINCMSATNCTGCVGGYTIHIDGSCQIPPGPPCVAYDKTLTCTQCSGTFQLQSGSCVFVSDCNITGTCPTCSYNHYLSVGHCFLCPRTFQCRSCNVNDANQCLACNNGYHVNSGYTCSQCVTGCAICRSRQFCSLASDGYFLRVNGLGANTGRVGECHQTCATCSISKSSCLSCKGDATLSGGHCTKKRHYHTNAVFRIQNFGGVEGSPEELGNMFILYSIYIDKMCTLIGFQDLYTCLLYLQTLEIGHGSVSQVFTVAADVVTADPSVVLSTADLSPLTFVSASSALNGASSSSLSSVSLGLVLGVAIPLGVLLIAIIVVIKVKYSSSTEEEMFDPSEKQIEFNEQF